jgi:tRNA-dihydrouridine synthase 3
VAPLTTVGTSELPDGEYLSLLRQRAGLSSHHLLCLTTIGNLPFRRIMKRFQADITCGEMALATHLLEGKPSEWALLKRSPDEDVFGIQLAAGYPDIFTRTMELIESHLSVDFVDLNLGCPLDMVCNKGWLCHQVCADCRVDFDKLLTCSCRSFKGSGAALMMRDKRLQSSLEGITSVLTSCQVTIKMRTGWDEKLPFAHELVPKIQAWGYGDAIGAIMVHGRSRLQRYSKEADWDYISRVACSQDQSLHTIPVIGNGDILSFTDYEEKVLQAKGVVPCAMLGRGALIKPWLPTEIKDRRHWDISASERLDFLREFVRFGLLHWGSDQQGVNNCRRFLLEWLSFLHRYVPVGLLEQYHAQRMNQRPPKFLCGRSDLETLFMSSHCSDWIKISEMLLGPVPQDFHFEPKHKANAY